MSWISDATVDRLKQVAALPDIPTERYLLYEPIGEGGMGTVFRAWDDALDREIAIKVTHQPANPAWAERLQREARVLARLEHPGIVPVHDVGTLPDGRLFYVMKRVNGQTLSAWTAQQPQLDRRLAVFERICETVAFAHVHDVVHRDLKPDNIMIGAFGEVLVLDWGVAKLLAESGQLDGHTVDDTDVRVPESAGLTAPGTLRGTLPGTLMGTPGFMAPEQAMGDAATVDRRADVYALGAVLYQLLTGTPPVVGEDAHRAILEEREIPKRLRAICAVALASSPGERYPDAAALGEEIVRFRAGQAVHAYHESPLDRADRFMTTYRTPILLVVAYLVMRLAFELLRR